MLTWPGTENITYAFAMCAPDALTNSRLLDFNRQLAEEQELFRDLLILHLGKAKPKTSKVC